MARGSCIVFDLDDTLYLERDYVRSGFAAVAARLAIELGAASWFDSLWGLFESGERGKTFDRLLAEKGHGNDPLLVNSLVALYRNHAPAIHILDDAEACMSQLRGLTPMAVVTDGPIESQVRKADALGVGLWAAPVIYTAALGADFGKPHPRAFALAQESHRAEPQRCVYVADNPAKDFVGPRRLGWRTVRVRRPEGLHAKAPSRGDVDLEVRDLRGLPRWLEQEGILERRTGEP